MSQETGTQAGQEQQTGGAAASYNPFLVNVNEKPYSQMNVEVSQDKIYQPIPEPTFQGNTVKASEDAYSMLNGEMGMTAGAAPTGGAFPFGGGSSMNGLPEADQKAASMEMAKMIVDGYSTLKSYANLLLRIPEKKLKKLQDEGEIDLSVQIPYAEGQTVSAIEFVQEFNEQNKDTLSTTKEFKKEVTPVLARVLQKRGLGLSDENLLLYLFGKDMAITGVQIYQVRKTSQDIIDVIKEYTAALKEGQKAQGVAVTREDIKQGDSKGGDAPAPPSSPSPAPSRPPRQPKPPKQPRQPRAQVPTDDDRFNFNTNETVMDSVVVKHTVPESGKARLMAQKKRDAEIAEAMKRADKMQNGETDAYQAMMQAKKTGKRGRQPKDYIKPVDEAKIAEAIVLSETKTNDSEEPLIPQID